ncbi:MAG TPA: GTP 3',8-cyclase MoaA [Aquifex aeolicus]|uniref:GTP 3',8-cyclase n=1 Tax=Aquifex aeolicus TaxID=63363 RepID=A0A9D0YQ14_AQUAO|nr:GTP 3',8-cyclase MoaA [Aquifex aeolicus]
MSKKSYIPPVRGIRYLRISLTDACNFRCLYCRGENFRPTKEVLTLQRVELILKVFSLFGLKTVRFTGGEPLLRKDIIPILKVATQYVEDVSLTTNGFLLERYAKQLKEVGLKRLNVSLDSLNTEKFQRLTGGNLEVVLRGVYEAKNYFNVIKINTVAIRGFTEEEVDGLLEFCAKNGFHLRFIELMPVGELPFFKKEHFLPLEEIKKYIENRYGKLEPIKSNGSGSSKDFYLPSLNLKVGFIKSVTEPFCEGCEKFRITPDGKVHLCLRTTSEIDLLPHLTSEENLEKFVPRLLALKGESNRFIALNGFGWFATAKSMIGIGG